MDTSQLLHADIADLLRDLLRQSRPDDKNSVLDAWLARLVDMAPERAARELARRLASELAQASHAERRLKLLDAFSLGAERILPPLELAIENAPLPLGPTELATALAADSLLKALAGGYVALTREIAAAAAAQADLLPVARRAMQMLARRQWFEFRAHVSPSAGSWKLLHETYRQAESHGLADPGSSGAPLDTDPPTHDPLAHDPLTHEYVSALLFAICEPGRLPRPLLRPVHALLAGLAPQARLRVTAAAASGEAAARFLLVSEPGRPPLSLARLAKNKALPVDGRVLDCADIVTALDGMIAGGDEIGPLPLLTLRSLRDAINGLPAARQFSRTQFRPRVNVIAGLPAMLDVIAGKTLGRRQGDAGSPDTREGSEWLLSNESPDGFGIRPLGVEAPLPGVGDIVLLRPREHGKLHICLVRRSNGAPREQLELGLQLLCSSATVIPLPAEDIRLMGQQGLLLPNLPAFGNAPGLIAPAAALTPRSVITENQGGTLKYYRLGVRIESSNAAAFHLLQAL